MKRKGDKVDGWLCLDKPYGLGSTQALAKARRLLNAQKAGHGGTLDPLASGILPIAFGEATKTVAYVMDADKDYRFSVTWGIARTTDDAEGEVIATSPHRPTRAAIEAVLPQFIGTQLQKPPAFSALKVDGARAYDLARQGEVVDLAARSITITALTLVNMESEDVATFEVTCGKGTYVRSLARDLAEKLGTVGYVSALRRLRVGRFSESNAILLDELAKKEHNTQAGMLLLPLETALDDILALAITEQEAQSLRLGQRLPVVGDLLSRVAALTAAQRLEEAPIVLKREATAIGLGQVAAGELRTVRLFNR